MEKPVSPMKRAAHLDNRRITAPAACGEKSDASTCAKAIEVDSIRVWTKTTTEKLALPVA
jgi:hypothetical protein